MQETGSNWWVVGFSVDDLLAFLLSGMTVDQLLDIIQKSLVRIAEPCASRWVTYGLDSGGTPARERTERSAHSSV